MFNKSRTTISTVLRPQNVDKVRALASSGHSLEAKRCKMAQVVPFCSPCSGQPACKMLVATVVQVLVPTRA